jgi:hypothetical protein
MVAVVVRTTAVLILTAANIAATVRTSRTIRIGIAARHAGKGIRAADLVVTATERTARFTRFTDTLARGGVTQLSIGAWGYTLVVAALIVVRAALRAAEIAIGAAARTRRRVTRFVIRAAIIALAVAAFLAVGAAIAATGVRRWADTTARVGIERLGRIALRADALTIAAGCIVGADRDAFAVRAHLAAAAGVTAAATVIMVALRVDTPAIAGRHGISALTLPKLAGGPRITGMTTRTTVVGVGANVDALATAADLAGRAQAAIPVLTVLKPLVIEAVRSNLATETRELQSRMEAEAVAGGLLVEEHVLKGGIFAMRDATAGRGGSGCLNRSSDQRSDQAA